LTDVSSSSEISSASIDIIGLGSLVKSILQQQQQRRHSNSQRRRVEPHESCEPLKFKDDNYDPRDYLFNNLKNTLSGQHEMIDDVIDGDIDDGDDENDEDNGIVNVMLAGEVSQSSAAARRAVGIAIEKIIAEWMVLEHSTSSTRLSNQAVSTSSERDFKTTPIVLSSEPDNQPPAAAAVNTEGPPSPIIMSDFHFALPLIQSCFPQLRYNNVNFPEDKLAQVLLSLGAYFSPNMPTGGQMVVKKVDNFFCYRVLGHVEHARSQRWVKVVERLMGLNDINNNNADDESNIASESPLASGLEAYDYGRNHLDDIVDFEVSGPPPRLLFNRSRFKSGSEDVDGGRPYLQLLNPGPLRDNFGGTDGDVSDNDGTDRESDVNYNNVSNFRNGSESGVDNNHAQILSHAQYLLETAGIEINDQDINKPVTVTTSESVSDVSDFSTFLNVFDARRFRLSFFVILKSRIQRFVLELHRMVRISRYNSPETITRCLGSSFLSRWSQLLDHLASHSAAFKALPSTELLEFSKWFRNFLNLNIEIFARPTTTTSTTNQIQFQITVTSDISTTLREFLSDLRNRIIERVPSSIRIFELRVTSTQGSLLSLNSQQLREEAYEHIPNIMKKIDVTIESIEGRAPPSLTQSIDSCREEVRPFDDDDDDDDMNLPRRSPPGISTSTIIVDSDPETQSASTGPQDLEESDVEISSSSDSSES